VQVPQFLLARLHCTTRSFPSHSRTFLYGVATYPKSK
jgi:hypothetical protein